MQFIAVHVRKGLPMISAAEVMNEFNRPVSAHFTAAEVSRFDVQILNKFQINDFFSLFLFNFQNVKYGKILRSTLNSDRSPDRALKSTSLLQLKK